MKKVLYTILSLLFIAGHLTLSAQDQNYVSFTIKAVPGSDNKAKVYLTSTNAFSRTITNTFFTFLLPATISPRPDATFTSAAAFSHILHSQITGSPTTEVVSGTNFHVYTFSSVYTGSLVSNIQANTETEVGEISFTNVPQVSTNAEVRLAYVTQGGTTGLAGIRYEAGGNNYMNANSLFYGPGAVNPNPAPPDGFGYVGVSIVLPVKFLSFYALKNDDNAKLNWTVEGDEENKYFEVERSTDGRVFKSIAKINAVGNGRSVNTYETVDQRLSGLGANTVFYRIKQTDINGNIVYSSIKNLNATRRSTPVQIIPNPAKTTTKLVFDADNAGKGTILVRDMQGKLVLQYSATLVKGINQQELNVAALASGDYNVTVTGQGFTHTLKLSKIN